MGGNGSTVFKGLAHLELSQVTSWLLPAATISCSLHCSPPSPARAFSCLLQALTTFQQVSLILSQQVTRNVQRLPPSGFKPCPSNGGERRTMVQCVLQRCREEAQEENYLPGPVEAMLLSSLCCIFVD